MSSTLYVVMTVVDAVSMQLGYIATFLRIPVYMLSPWVTSTEFVIMLESSLVWIEMKTLWLLVPLLKTSLVLSLGST